MERESIQSYITKFRLAEIITLEPEDVVREESKHGGEKNIARVERQTKLDKGLLLQGAELELIERYVIHKQAEIAIRKEWSIKDALLINPAFDNTRCRFDIRNNKNWMVTENGQFDKAN